MEGMEGIEVSTEAMTLENAVELVRETDSGVISDWLKGLLPWFLNFGFQILLAVVVYAVGARIIKLVRSMVRRWMERADADIGVKQFIDSLVKYFLYFILVVIILTFFGVTTASVVAVLGSAGLALGLAVQGTLSNFAGGVLILLLKPFHVGDYIIEDTHGNEGTVTEITIFYTKLSTGDNKIIVIPNGSLANSSLTNVTHSKKRRMDLEVGISYDSDLKKAKDILYRLADEERDRLKSEEILVFVSELAASEVKIGLRFWVKTEDYWNVRWRLLESIKLSLDEAEIEIPYQKLDVQVKGQ
ncbi:mechanosensitive ion channel domain-containing protein [Lachnospiraceae bacterium 38-14]|jgi:Small-conductance mechanosensitive channel|uniref:mechanosensitive ion channel family protein n=1 Tax=Roseburia sp. 1XD42-69 TaxID=2320088 RepID=UPI001FAA0C3C|nr:mechanosensitive ion channel domain-containing protein [Roseburia sp. 1XD42-69]